MIYRRSASQGWRAIPVGLGRYNPAADATGVIYDRQDEHTVRSFAALLDGRVVFNVSDREFTEMRVVGPDGGKSELVLREPVDEPARIGTLVPLGEGDLLVFAALGEPSGDEMTRDNIHLFDTQTWQSKVVGATEHNLLQRDLPAAGRPVQVAAGWLVNTGELGLIDPDADEPTVTKLADLNSQHLIVGDVSAITAQGGRYLTYDGGRYSSYSPGLFFVENDGTQHRIDWHNFSTRRDSGRLPRALTVGDPLFSSNYEHESWLDYESGVINSVDRSRAFGYTQPVEYNGKAYVAAKSDDGNWSGLLRIDPRDAGSDPGERVLDQAVGHMVSGPGGVLTQRSSGEGGGDPQWVLVTEDWVSPPLASLSRSDFIGAAAAPLSMGFVFGATDANGVQQVFYTDGTFEGTRQLSTFVWDSTANQQPPDRFVAHGGRAFFTAANAGERRVWSTDGTPDGTRQVPGVPPLTNQAQQMVVGVQDGAAVLYDARGDRIWTTDGTPGNTRVVAESIYSAVAVARSREGGEGRLQLVLTNANGRTLWTFDGSHLLPVDTLSHGVELIDTPNQLEPPAEAWFRSTDADIGNAVYRFAGIDPTPIGIASIVTQWQQEIAIELTTDKTLAPMVHTRSANGWTLRHEATGEQIAADRLTLRPVEEGLTLAVAGTLASGRPADAVYDLAGRPMVADTRHAFTFLQGDANDDGRVNLADFATLRRNFGREDAPLSSDADFNFDDRVDLADFALLRQNFGTVMTSMAATSGGGRQSLFARHGSSDDEQRRLI